MFVLVSIGILALLILVHEAGHFAAAKLQGIHVNRFSLGFGPVVWAQQGGETEYAVRALPLGGFVGFPDEDEDCPYPPNDPNLLKNRPVLDRLVVMGAGVLANLVFAYVALALMITLIGIPTVSHINPGILIPQVVAESPAEVAGLQAGDVILAAEQDQAVYDYRDVDSEAEIEAAISQFQDLILASSNQPLQLQVARSEADQTKTLTLTVVPTPQTPEAQPIIGVNLAPDQEIAFRSAQGVGEIVVEAGSAYQRVFLLNVEGFKQLIQNFGATASQVAGPVGIVKIGADLAQSDAGSLFNFTALISINLAIINLLPLPALDGGHIAFLLLEAVRGKRLPKQLEERVMQTGLVLLLGLGIVLIFKDTIAIVTGTD